MPAVFIDTNLLVYAFDQRDPQRQRQAIEVLQKLQASHNGRLSVQSLAEFFSTVTRKLQPSLTLAEAFQQLERLSQAFPVLDLTASIVLEAARR